MHLDVVNAGGQHGVHPALHRHDVKGVVPAGSGPRGEIVRHLGQQLEDNLQRGDRPRWSVEVPALQNRFANLLLSWLEAVRGERAGCAGAPLGEAGRTPRCCDEKG